MAEEKREKILASRPTLPEEWASTFAFYGRLAGFRGSGFNGPSPLALADILALYQVDAPIEPSFDELIQIVQTLEQRYFKAIEKKAAQAPKPKPTKPAGR